MSCQKESPSDRLERITIAIATGLSQNPDYINRDWLIAETAIRTAKSLIVELDKEMSRPSHLLNK